MDEEESELFSLWERLNAEVEDVEVLKLYANLFARTQLNRVAREYFKAGNAQLASSIRERAEKIGAL